MTLIAPYGEWPSPIDAAASAHVTLSFPTATGSEVWWQETRPSEGGRQVVMRQGNDGISRELLPAPWNARHRVHEYGGKSYLPVPGGFVFLNFTDQRMYHCAVTGNQVSAPRPLTPAPADTAADRFAELALSRSADEVWCVRERHSSGRVSRAIVAVPIDGSGTAGSVRVLVTGSDFYAFPTPSPDGTKLAWICWDHPRMPWDGTELRVAAIDDTANYQVLMGGEQESVLTPTWRDDQALYAISDRSGWWNIYLAGAEAPPAALCPREEEFAGPMWQLGSRSYGVLADGRLAAVHGTGETSLGLLDPETGQLTDLDLPFRVFSYGVSVSGQTVAGIAGAPTTPITVFAADVADVADGDVALRRLASNAGSLPDAAYLPTPRLADLTGPSGAVVHALVYPPTSPDAAAPDGELPPYIVWVHGGPTSQVFGTLDLEKAYFTSRGIGIVDVNYGGSSGYGRAYRERLRGQWGIVDVDDVRTAVLAMSEAGEADGKRLGIRGGSAGGWTALAAVTTGVGGARDGVFAAATSYYGVTDLRGFAEQTHDFEARYLEGLVGPLPQEEALYVERAPVGHVTDATSPVLLLQGLDDPIVLPAQAESIARDLTEHGIRYAYLSFAGESHGFRKADTVVACLEAELSFYGQIMGFVPPGVPTLPLIGEG